jgi:hypothetical protein
MHPDRRLADQIAIRIAQIENLAVMDGNGGSQLHRSGPARVQWDCCHNPPAAERSWYSETAMIHRVSRAEPLIVNENFWAGR